MPLRAGWSPAAREARRLQPPRQYVEQLRHQRTLRGHHFAVYCIAFDRTGRYVITGSDDHLVKVCVTSGFRVSRGRGPQLTADPCKCKCCVPCTCALHPAVWQHKLICFCMGRAAVLGDLPCKESVHDPFEYCSWQAGSDRALNDTCPNSTASMQRRSGAWKALFCWHPVGGTRERSQTWP